MKKFIIAIGLVLTLTVSVSAQQYNYFGPTVKIHDNITSPNVWWGVNPSGTTISSLELKGYDSVRVDYDLSYDTLPSTDSEVSIDVNFMCSNDSIWTSGDSITVDADHYDTFDLIGCQDYTIYIELISQGDTIDSIYMTPYND